MNNFIRITDYDATIHREILDSLLREDAGSSATVEVCENRAMATVRAMIGNRYDCDAVFSATGDQRNVIILKVCVDIAVYEIFSRHNPYKMAQIRKDRYDDAMEFLREVRDFKSNIDGLPLLPEEMQRDNSLWQVESDTLRATHF